MNQLDLFRLVVETLERLQVRYAVVGSFASGAWGEPRLTQDVDLLVDLDLFEAQALCGAFADDAFYISRDAAAEAVAGSGQFNLLHPASGDKIDFMVVGDTAWANSQLDRSVRLRLLPDRDVSVATAEDVILGKLLYYRDGGSEKHVRDITGILTTCAAPIDHDYLEQNARALGVNEEWASILRHLNG